MRHGQRSWDTARTLGAARHAMAPLTITADDDQIYMVDVDLADPVENLKVCARAGARPHERARARERERAGTDLQADDLNLSCCLSCRGASPDGTQRWPGLAPGCMRGPHVTVGARRRPRHRMLPLTE